MTDEASKPAVRLDQQLCFALYGAAHAFTRAYKPLLDPLGLTYPQYIVMMALWEKDGTTVKALGTQLGLDSGTLSPLLRRLELASRIAKRRDETDERQVRIYLTAEGRAMEAAAEKIMLSIGRATGCKMSEMVDLRDRLHLLKDNLEKVE
ncbi:MarR family winged helix-turn-helix transcriptional regulator [Rhizobium halophytocola]|uniref:DNA-binding MarR family transcriptional regulator n=1 Tax=Rhizobium halophytocola TaxID=735519 RepID=A0ABS4DX33_9HYPH|nr:MarR family transcriptional regulator [Rhizobium halophytocola]MBP1850219.1 DNA-binding MarR family transcriptional regulator [Rhizobium halophytocola]